MVSFGALMERSMACMRPLGIIRVSCRHPILYQPPRRMRPNELALGLVYPFILLSPSPPFPPHPTSLTSPSIDSVVALAPDRTTLRSPPPSHPPPHPPPSAVKYSCLWAQRRLSTPSGVCCWTLRSTWVASRRPARSSRTASRASTGTFRTSIRQSVSSDTNYLTLPCGLPPLTSNLSSHLFAALFFLPYLSLRHISPSLVPTSSLLGGCGQPYSVLCPVSLPFGGKRAAPQQPQPWLVCHLCVCCIG